MVKRRKKASEEFGGKMGRDWNGRTRLRSQRSRPDDRSTKSGGVLDVECRWVLKTEARRHRRIDGDGAAVER